MTVHWTHHAAERALTRCPGLTLEALGRACVEALQVGRASPVKPAWLRHPYVPERNEGVLYAWSEEGLTFALVAGDVGWFVRTVLTPDRKPSPELVGVGGFRVRSA